MIYLDYEVLKLRLWDAQKMYDGILTEKEQLFAMTQPHGVQFDKERVAGGTPDDSTFDRYLSLKEAKNIDRRLAEAKAIMDDRAELLHQKEEELRQSKEVLDRLYCMRVLDRVKIQWITRQLNYSESHVYRMLGQIYQTMLKMRENEKNIVIE